MSSVAVDTPAPVERLLRELAPQVLGILVRRYGDFDTCEDAVQEALLAAARPVAGRRACRAIRDGWLITVATRRLIEMWRSEAARRRREEAVGLADACGSPAVRSGADDTLTLLLLCCHPSLTRARRSR